MGPAFESSLICERGGEENTQECLREGSEGRDSDVGASCHSWALNPKRRRCGDERRRKAENSGPRVLCADDPKLDDTWNKTKRALKKFPSFSA